MIQSKCWPKPNEKKRKKRAKYSLFRCAKQEVVLVDHRKSLNTLKFAATKLAKTQSIWILLKPTLWPAGLTSSASQLIGKKPPAGPRPPFTLTPHLHIFPNQSAPDLSLHRPYLLTRSPFICLLGTDKRTKWNRSAHLPFRLPRLPSHFSGQHIQSTETKPNSSKGPAGFIC